MPTFVLTNKCTMEKKKDGFPNEKAIVIPQENLLKIKENPMTRLLHPTDAP